MDTSAVRMALPESLGSVCYLSDIEGRCTGEEVEALRNGSAVVRDWVLVGVEGNAMSGGRRVEVSGMVVALGIMAVFLGL
jgi:hypothetical protein